MSKEMNSCKECNYLKCYSILHQCYYCDHESRPDDMGKLGIDQLPEISPEWCPLRKEKEEFNNGK